MYEKYYIYSTESADIQNYIIYHRENSVLFWHLSVISVQG